MTRREEKPFGFSHSPPVVVCPVLPRHAGAGRIVACSSIYVCEIEERTRTIIKGPFNYSVPARPVLNPPRMGPLWSPAAAVRFEWVSRATCRRRMMKTQGSEISERRFGTRFLVEVQATEHCACCVRKELVVCM
ncbi:hypothetical protein MRX96_040685 [Rhipicephalus microplus]